MTTNQEKCYSLSFLIATPSSRTLDGLFELTQACLEHCSGTKRYKDSVWCGPLGTEVPEHS